jgi:hypothetical protein
VVFLFAVRRAVAFFLGAVVFVLTFLLGAALGRADFFAAALFPRRPPAPLIADS